MQFSSVFVAALAGLASAQKVHVVSVSSANASLTFSPNNLTTNVGDMVQFQFRAGNHSVVQSTFDQPCSPISAHTNTTGIFSGYQLVSASAATGMIPTYTIMIANKTPMWLYCSQAKHCQAGMVMVINENTAANSTRSLANFQNLAKAATANTSPSTATGGSKGTTSSGTTSSGTTTTGSGTATSTAKTGASATSTAGASSMAVSGLSVIAAVAAFFAL